VKIVLVGNVNCQTSSETHHVKSLESLGHQVVTLQEGQATGEQILAAAWDSQMLVFVHTHSWRTPGLPLVEVLNRLERAGIPTVTYHLDLWLGLERQKDLEHDPFYRAIGWFFTADKLMADWFCEHTAVKGRFLPAGVFDQECYISTQPSKYANDVIFVGSKRYHPEHPWRHQLIDWLRATYGSRFTHVGGDGDTGTIRGAELNALYANSKVAVGDTLCLGFDYPWYASDRLWECAGRAGFNLFPRIAGLDTWFKDGRDIVFYDYGDFEGLQGLIDYFLKNDEERESIRLAGHELVKAEHTYVQRWEAILQTVFA
jgi:hypothetical protein